MTAAVDLDAYFARIGYAGSRAPSLDTLQAIHRLHPQAIPFENLNPLIGWPVPLDAASLQEKLIHQGRGGYCYEHNLLFAHVLDALGFRVRRLAARVMWNVPEAEIRPRSHMLLAVDLEGGPFVADVGFGGLTLTAPLRLQTDVEQTTPHETFRLVGDDAEFVLQARLGPPPGRETWKALYRFGLEEHCLPDYELTSWYLSNHPQSQFVTTLIAARPRADCRYALRNNQFAVHHLDGPSEQRLLTDPAAVREVLQSAFGLTLPESPALDAALARIAAPVAIAT